MHNHMYSMYINSGLTAHNHMYLVVERCEGVIWGLGFRMTKDVVLEISSTKLQSKNSIAPRHTYLGQENKRKKSNKLIYSHLQV